MDFIYLVGIAILLGLCVALITAVTWALDIYPARARAVAA